jgi:hypothetical protein
MGLCSTCMLVFCLKEFQTHVFQKISYSSTQPCTTKNFPKCYPIIDLFKFKTILMAFQLWYWRVIWSYIFLLNPGLLSNVHDMKTSCFKLEPMRVLYICLSPIPLHSLLRKYSSERPTLIIYMNETKIYKRVSLPSYESSLILVYTVVTWAICTNIQGSFT